MPTIQKRLEQIYKDFKVVTKPRFVREGHRGDAFTLLAFEILFRKYHGIDEVNIDNHMELLERSIVIPPDGGVDIFFQDDALGDEPKFHVVQCKDTSLQPEEIRDCFLKMYDSLECYLENKQCKKNLKRVLFENDFDRDSLRACTFYVVHQGTVEQIPNQRPNEAIITSAGLAKLADLLIADSVPYKVFGSDAFNNFILNNFGDPNPLDPDVPKSILCNLNGYDLAQLDNDYSKSELGRSILYGGNLRDSLSEKKSKTYAKMFRTIEDEPHLFLYYNNGVTILAEKLDRRSSDDALELRNFSVINGAQTTSTLGAFLRKAELAKDTKAIEKLKKVLVLTKIYEVDPATPRQKDISDRIRIYSNTQTPLASRDMVSINDEQKRLQDRFWQSTPQIFVNIKTGEEMRKPSRTPKHGEVTNEKLAQLALCAFHFEPGTVLRKKAQIFEPGGSDDDGFLINDTYDKLFNPERGVLFKKSSWDIDELLFVQKLHSDTKLQQKKTVNEQKRALSTSSPQDSGMTPQQRDALVDTMKRTLEIGQRCFYFNVCAYYKLRLIYDPSFPEVNTTTFDSRRYYDNKDKTFKEELIKAFSKLVFERTVQIIQDNSGLDNVYTWLRREESEKIFFTKLQESFARDLSLKSLYRDFISTYKIQRA